jgi:hypothetical protein
VLLGFVLLDSASISTGLVPIAPVTPVVPEPSR